MKRIQVIKTAGQRKCDKCQTVLPKDTYILEVKTSSQGYANICGQCLEDIAVTLEESVMVDNIKA